MREFFSKVVNLRKYKKQIILLARAENVFEKWVKGRIILSPSQRIQVLSPYLSILLFINVTLIYDDWRQRKVTSASLPDQPLTVPEVYRDKSEWLTYSSYILVHHCECEYFQFSLLEFIVLGWGTILHSHTILQCSSK
jgi:hypothetical protein